MRLTLERKKAIVKEVAEVASRATAVIAAEYRGLSVADMTRLRRYAREANVILRVVRNTLARRALEGTEFACMRDGLVGPLLLAFSPDEPSAAKVVREFVKENNQLVVKLVATGGRLLEASAVESLATLPTHEQAISMLMGVMKAPVEKFVRTLAAPYSALVRTMAAVSDQKRAA
ncbi:MAG: 50S ribosomal protein L10 [Gammaproteobacteria bacterium]|nr:50S ribosomal protein L10 [Gammaproteobacteria bacterium]MCI0590353.1 50S ribosomal protein L10 [Gammaproteobacteria bacterium]